MCPGPYEIPNANMDGSYEFNKTMVIRCLAGFRLTHFLVATLAPLCGPDGAWSEDLETLRCERELEFQIDLLFETRKLLINLTTFV